VAFVAAAPPAQQLDRETGRSGGVRVDIQGLRALAVSLVLVYHLFPGRLTGGFIGVDVFFVISGFLITSHLMAHPPQRGRDLLVFWGRRIRRLLPASLLVLTATLLASQLFAPETRWQNTGVQAGAAALYGVNWILARDSVDYLAAVDAPSPVQHFWSLSVEEQFYLFWPVLILLLGLLALVLRRKGVRNGVVYGAGLGIVVAASLAWSVHATAANPRSAYFITTTRIWELGLGGLLAVWVVTLRRKSVVLSQGARAGVAWLGFAMIAWAAVTYNVHTPFPSWRALLPVLGTVLVIGAAAGPQRWSPGSLLAPRPVQWMGDVSYSVYLWHWPIIVLLPVVSGGRLGWLDKLVVVLTTLLLAGFTKTYVEDFFRSPAWNRRLRLTYLGAAIGMVLVVSLASLMVAEVHHDKRAAKARLQQALVGDNPCFGAGALDKSRHCPPWSGDPVPSPALAAQDKSDAYPNASGRKDCWSFLPDYPTTTCQFGDPNGDIEVALVGNSHAGQWLPALQEIADKRGWHITTYLASRCAMADLRQQYDTRAESTECLDWVRHVSEKVVADHPDLVVLSNRIQIPAEGLPLKESLGPFEDGYRAVLDKWSTAGLTVVALQDTPAPVNGGLASIPDCLASHPNDMSACSGSLETWETADPLMDAVAAVGDPNVTALRLNDHICDGDRCNGVVGGVVVYFDGTHLTATYARTLAPYLAPGLAEALRAR
jgi:peptidoglycan/LPS O-acetylase OafA/YrhL